MFKTQCVIFWLVILGCTPSKDKQCLYFLQESLRVFEIRSLLNSCEGWLVMKPSNSYEVFCRRPEYLTWKELAELGYFTKGQLESHIQQVKVGMRKCTLTLLKEDE